MLLLVRHGESEANAAGRLVGRIDSALTPRGLRQAAGVGALLGASARPVCKVVTSPLGRARQTAEVVAEALGAGPVEIDERWIELDYGKLDGEPVAALGGPLADGWRSDPGWRGHGGETLAELATRVQGACEEIAAPEATGPGGPEGAGGPGGDTVVVSHVSPIKAAVAWAIGAPDEVAWRMHLHPGSLTRVGFGPFGPRLETFNELPGSSRR